MQEPKVVIVTGATSGVGRGIALELAGRGVRVVATGRNLAEGENLCTQGVDLPGEIVFVPGDVTVQAATEAVVQSAVDRFGRVDVLVCNAGVVGDPAVQNTHEVSLDSWERVLRTNLTGPFLSARAVLPQMIDQMGGLILTVASVNAQIPVTRMAAYNASKAGLVQFTRTLALEYLMWGVRANTIILGGADGGTNDAVQNGIIEYVHGQPPTPEQIAANAAINGVLNQSAQSVGAAIAALCSDDLSGMTGATIHLDRGLANGLLTDLAMYMTVSGQWSLAGS